MSVIIEARVKQKKDTLSNWNSNQLVLLDGESAFVVDESGMPVNFKIGDGTKKFNELPYWIRYDQSSYIKYTGNPTQNIAYTIVGSGVYGNITIPEGEMAVLGWNGSQWSVDSNIRGIKGEDGEDGNSLLPLWESGKAGGYPINAQVRDADGNTYVSLVEANTAAVTDAGKWVSVLRKPTSSRGDNEKLAISQKEFTESLSGIWQVITDYTGTIAQTGYASTDGKVGDTISLANSGKYGIVSITDIMPGDIIMIKSSVVGANLKTPLFVFSNSSGKVAGYSVLQYFQYSSLEKALYISSPEGAASLYINLFNNNGWPNPVLGFEVKKVKKIKQGVEDKISTLEDFDKNASSSISLAKTSLQEEEGDLCNGNYSLFNGRITNTSNGIPDGDSGYFTTDFFQCKKGNNYRIAFYNNSIGALLGTYSTHYFDKDKKPLLLVQQATSVAPEDGFIRFSFVSSGNQYFSAMYYAMVLNQIKQAEYIANANKIFKGIRNRLSNNTYISSSNFTPEIRSFWHGKTLMYIGDSWSHQYSAIDGGNFISKIKKRFGFANAYRCAQGGQSFCQLPTVITYAATHRYLPLPSEEAIKGVDCCVVFMGQNSRVGHPSIPGSGAPIGSITDAPSIDPMTSTIYGQVKYYVEYLLKKNGKMRIFLSSPGFSFENNGGYIPRLTDISQAIKAVATYYRVGYIPTFEECWGFANYQNYLRKKDPIETSDWLHPSFTSEEINGTSGSDRIAEVHAKHIIC